MCNLMMNVHITYTLMESVVKYLDGTSDSDNLIIIVYIYLGITVLALVILCLSYCYYYIYQPKNRKKIVFFTVVTTFIILSIWLHKY